MPDDARTIGGWRALVAGGRRSEWAVTSIVLAILAVVAFGAVAAPRLLRDAEASSLEQAITDAPDSSLNESNSSTS